MPISLFPIRSFLLSIDANSNSLLNCLHRLEQSLVWAVVRVEVSSSYDNIPMKQQLTLPLIWFSMSEPLDVDLE